MGLWPAGDPSCPHWLLCPPAPRTTQLLPALGPRRPAASNRTHSSPGPLTFWWGLASGEPPQVSGEQGEREGSAFLPPPSPASAACGWPGPSPRPAPCRSPPSPGSWGGCSPTAPTRAAAPPRVCPPPRPPPRRVPVRINPAEVGRACGRMSSPGADGAQCPPPPPTPDLLPGQLLVLRWTGVRSGPRLLRVHDVPAPGLSSHRRGRGPQTARPGFRGVAWAVPEVTLATSHSCGQPPTQPRSAPQREPEPCASSPGPRRPARLLCRRGVHACVLSSSGSPAGQRTG